MENFDAEVLTETMKAIAQARELYPRYARNGPAGTCFINDMLRKANCERVVYPFESDAAAIALPEFRGRRLLFQDSRQRREDRMFQDLHELCHTLRNESGARMLRADEAYMAPYERVADTFAFADLIPTWALDSAARDGCTDEQLTSEIRGAIHVWAGEWPEERVEDRARLRIMLWRECGV